MKSTPTSVQDVVIPSEEIMLENADPSNNAEGDTIDSPSQDNVGQTLLDERDNEDGDFHGFENVTPTNSISIERRYPLRNRIPKIIRSMQTTHDVFVPSSFKEAMESAEANLWKDAIEEEYTSLIKNQTWTIKPLPAGRKPIDCKWVFTIKPGHHEVPPRFKARLVARGFSQRPGVDFQETFAPVVKNSTITPVHHSNKKPGNNPI